MKSSVSRAVREKRGHTSDQGEVWREVDALHSTHGVSSDTSAMSDAYDMHRGQIEEYQERLKYVDGATGAAVAIGNKMIDPPVVKRALSTGEAAVAAGLLPSDWRGISGFERISSHLRSRCCIDRFINRLTR